MNILVVNDDGINAPGLQTLVKHLSQIGDVYVCAPDSEKSAFSHHFDYTSKIKFEQRSIPYAKDAYALYGTPADCTHYGILFLFKDIKIDLVVSGINRGWNVLNYVITSGTVAGAREAFMMNVPSMAVSLNSFDYDLDYNAAASIAKDIALLHVNNKDNDKYYINVNVPSIPAEDIKGIKICNVLGRVVYGDGLYLEDTGTEKYICQSVNEEVSIDTPEGSDTKELLDGYVTISPLDNDHVNHNYEDIDNIYIK